MSPIHTTIFCHPWQYPSHLPRLADEAEADMRAAGAINIRDMQYRIRRDVMVDGTNRYRLVQGRHTDPRRMGQADR